MSCAAPGGEIKSMSVRAQDKRTKDSQKREIDQESAELIQQCKSWTWHR